VIDWLEASALAEYLRRSRWTYPLVNAGHITGIALLFGAVVPMAVESFRPGSHALRHRLRPYAIAGFALAVICGALLFIAQASDYLQNRWFLAKLALIALAMANAALHLRAEPLPARAAVASILLWAAALVAGRMIAFA
jgi:hypothetical protein